MSLSTVLSVEASISVIDGYLGLLNTLTQIARQPAFDDMQSLVIDCERTLGVEDTRLRKLAALASGTFSPMPIRTPEAENSYYRGHFRDALAQSEALMEGSPDDVDAIALAAECYALTSQEPSSNRTQPPIRFEVLAGLTALASRAGSLDQSPRKEMLSRS